jgi:RNase adaptor protein for sRNA GlmZ degradation
LRVLIVGVCSSGKSTLEAGLAALGYEARTCVQEHSYLPAMWQSVRPDVLVYLDATADTVRRRGQTGLSEASLDEQRQILAHARAHADLVIQTDRLSAEKVLRRVRRFLDKRISAPTAPS